MSPNAPFLAPERDGAFKFGRPRAGATTYYTIPGVSARSASTWALAVDLDYYTPWYTSTPLMIDQLAFEVTTALASSNTRVGFYAADGDWQPVGPPLADSGDIATASTGVKTYAPGAPIYVRRGRYLSVLNHSITGNVTMRTGSGSMSGSGFATGLGASACLAALKATRAHAAFPNPGTAWTAVDADTGGFHNMVFYRVSSP